VLKDQADFGSGTLDTGFSEKIMFKQQAKA